MQPEVPSEAEIADAIDRLLASDDADPIDTRPLTSEERQAELAFDA